MRHIITSDTHSPQCIEKAFAHMKTIIDKERVDAIVINGDMLGMFSIDSSMQYRYDGVTDDVLVAHLQTGAPQWYAKYGRSVPNAAAVVEYVAERYAWCFETIRRFAELRKTYFNLGNHESRLTFHVMHELPFLTRCSSAVLDAVDWNALEQIFDEFEHRLSALERTHAFTYIRNAPLLDDDVLILGIPGESHATTGSSPHSLIQERKTAELCMLAEPLLKHARAIIIYNHTQGNYDRSTGTHSTASPSLQAFMDKIPAAVKLRLYVQSHNHWSYTQFIRSKEFDYVLNNAGLHDGLYNLIEITDDVRVFDVNPSTKDIQTVMLGVADGMPKTEIEVIGRHYVNPLESLIERRTSLGKQMMHFCEHD